MENDNDRITVWDANTGEKTAEFNTDQQWDVRSTSARRWWLDDDTLAFYQHLPRAGELNFFDAASNQVIATIPTKYPIERMFVGPDGKALVTLSRAERKGDEVSECDLIVWDVATRKPKFVLEGHDNKISTMALSHDGKTLATGYAPVPVPRGPDNAGWHSKGGTLVLWDVETGKRIKTIYDDGLHVFSIAFSRDGKQIAAGTRSKKLNENALFEIVKIWDVDSGEAERVIQVPLPSLFNAEASERAISLLFLPDGESLAIGGNGSFSVWNVVHGTMQHHHHHGIIATGEMLLGSDQKSIVFSASGSVNDKRRAQVFDLETGKFKLLSRARSRNYSRHMTFDVPEGTSVHGSSTSLDLNEETRTLAMCGYEHGLFGKTGIVRLWNEQTAQSSGSIRTAGEIRSVVYTPDSKTLIAGGFGPWRSLLQVYNVTTGKVLTRIANMGDPAVSPDGQLIAGRKGVNDRDGVTLYSRETGKEIATLPHKSAQLFPMFSPDGKWLLTSGGFKARVWDVEKIVGD